MSKVVTTTVLPRDGFDTLNIGATGDTVAIAGDSLNTNVLQDAGGNNIFTWTIKDIETIKSLEKLGVENFATDDITPSMLDKDKHVGRNYPTTL